jgi:hypothetical protein
MFPQLVVGLRGWGQFLVQLRELLGLLDGRSCRRFLHRFPKPLSVLARLACSLVVVEAPDPAFVTLAAYPDTDIPAAFAFLVKAPGCFTAPAIQFAMNPPEV